MTYGTGECYAYHSIEKTYNTWTYRGLVYIDPVGVIHPFPTTVEYYSSVAGGCEGTPVGPQPSSPTTVTATDGSGYQATLLAEQGALSVSLVNRYGTAIQAPIVANPEGQQGTLFEEDSNGNEITVSNGEYTDTTGNVSLTVVGSAPGTTTLTYNLPNSKTSAYTVAYTTYTVATAFGCSGIGEYGPTSVSLVSQITLPDSSSYQFTYEPTPGMSGDVTGRLASVTLPTGGTISYAYTGGCGSGVGTGIETDGTGGILTRVTSDGTRTYGRAGTLTASTTLFTDEKGNQTFYHFSQDSQGNFYTTDQQVYQGNTSSGSLLEQVTTCYNGSSGDCDGQSITEPVTEADVTSSYNGGTQLLTKNTLDSTGTVVTNTAYYSGSTLLEQVATPYTITSTGIYELNSSTTTDGSGNQVAQTTYGYDQTSVTATSGLPQHASVTGNRGNLTTTAVAVGGGASALSTTTTYYDTGQPVSTTAPGGFTTSYGYDSTQAFTESTTLPTPSSGVGLSTSANYDIASGALLSVTGMNSGQTFNITQYDSFLHPTTMTTPEGGQSTATYTQNQVSASTEMSSSQSTNQQTFLDSYGRTIRVALQSSSGWYLTDSCYDPGGLLQYRSPAYLSSSENPSSYNCSTANATQYTYDGLGRVTKVATPDGHTISKTYVGRALKIADNNGQTRILQKDLLGRLVGVCELASGTWDGGDTAQPCGNTATGSFDIGVPVSQPHTLTISHSTR